MRYLALDDSAAVAAWMALTNSTPLDPDTAAVLLKALSSSTAAPPQAAPSAAPPWETSGGATTSTSVTPVGHKSEQDMIIAGITYTPPPGGWPKKSDDQTGAGNGDAKRIWFATGSKGQGLYVDRSVYDAWQAANSSWSPTAVAASPDSYTPAQKMAAQFAAVTGGPMSEKASVWLAQELGGPKAVALGQMFGAQGTALLYNPLAAAAMSQLIAGNSADTVLANLTAQNTGTDGYRESLAALTPEWFTQAQATVAQFRG